ncbi:MAG: Rubredoxin-NAD(+) reductase [Pseudomonadota bacterium]|jgi:rubredoxin-NAD+ reductase
MKPLIIIGAGMAAYTCAREFRKLDKTAPMLIISSDAAGFYSKPMLSNALAQNKAAQLQNQSMEQMATQLQATIVANTGVLAIDPASHSVQTASQRYDYDKLVLAVGAQPIRLNFAGDAADQVLSVNHLSDYAIFRSKLESYQAKARVVVIGAGLIGCEFADDLAGSGYAVSVIDPNPLPLALLLPPQLGSGLQAALQARGVKMLLGTTATAINQHEGALRLTLANGNTLDADVVLSAVGLRADTRLAQAAGLQCERGIVVDANGQTSAPDIYALGDCAQYTVADGSSRTMPYIAPIMAAGRALAQTLTGKATPIDLKPVPVIVKTPSFPIALVAPSPQQAAGGSWQYEMQGERHVARFFAADGRMAGFALAPQEAALRQSLMAELNG